jgi:hypothetical protein
MTDSLRTLLDGAIDYAGLFPPAQLPLEPAIGNYARYRQESEAWMLGRFVVPTARLEELSPWVPKLFSSGPPLALVVLARTVESASAWPAAIAADVAAIDGIRRRHGPLVRIDGFEARLPPDVVAAEAVTACVRSVIQALPSVPVFVETSRPGEDRQAAAALANGTVDAGAGVKLRCGGQTAATFPSARWVAAVLGICGQAQAPLKLTAGLHHPLPQRDAALGATLHGFVNVLLAGAFLATGQADEVAVVGLLQDANPTHFQFEREAHWGPLMASVPDLAAARRSAVLSFGSCSFDEPRDDLRKLGWL